MADVDAANLIYHYLQKDLIDSQPNQFNSIACRLVLDLSVWIHPDDYARLPIVFPYIVRDPELSTKVRKPWGNPQPSTGYFKDDNSMIKAIVKGKNRVMNSGLVSRYNGKTLGRGFVASHVWREVPAIDSLANRDPRLFSFIPNLVWLPKELSRLSDVEGSSVQLALQKLSREIYRKLDLPTNLARFSEESWSLLDEGFDTAEELPVNLPEISELTFIRLPNKYVNLRISKIGALSNALIGHGNSSDFDMPKISSKYDPLIRTIDRSVALDLGNKLNDYFEALREVD